MNKELLPALQDKFTADSLNFLVQGTISNIANMASAFKDCSSLTYWDEEDTRVYHYAPSTQERCDQEVMIRVDPFGVESYGVKLKNYPSPPTIKVAFICTTGAFIEALDIEVDGDILWLPEMRVDDMYGIMYEKETWEERAKRLWGAENET